VDLNATLLVQSITMIIFVWFCMKFIWPMLMNLIVERQTFIADGLAAAEKGARSLEVAAVEKDKLLDEARGQARDIIDQANQRANSIIEEARSTADQEGERILVAARANVEQEANRAREELRSQVAGIAVAGAEKIIAREIDASTHRDLLDKLAAEI
jgi:F-type H+-transporting ATPase subunit b